MAILLTPVHLLVILLHSCPPTFSSLLVLSDSRPSTLSSSGIVVLLSFSRILGFSDSRILVPRVVLLQYRNVLSHFQVPRALPSSLSTSHTAVNCSSKGISHSFLF